MDAKDFLQSRFSTLLLGGILVLVMLVTAKLIIQKQEVDREIAKLENQADAIHKDNQQLSELIKYLNTTEYADRQAREKLNLKKEGEYVVVLPNESQNQGAVAGETIDTTPIPTKWFNYFFGN